MLPFEGLAQLSSPVDYQAEKRHRDHGGAVVEGSAAVGVHALHSAALSILSEEVTLSLGARQGASEIPYPSQRVPCSSLQDEDASSSGAGGTRVHHVRAPCRKTA